MTEETGGGGARVALVHDFLVDMRRAERVFLALGDLFPVADLFTAVDAERGTDGRCAGRQVRTSLLPGLRPSSRTFRSLLALYPSAMESLDPRGHDPVLSSSSAPARGVIPRVDAYLAGSDTTRRRIARHFGRGVRAVVDRAVAAGRGEGPARRRSPRQAAGVAWQA